MRVKCLWDGMEKKKKRLEEHSKTSQWETGRHSGVTLRCLLLRAGALEIGGCGANRLSSVKTVAPCCSSKAPPPSHTWAYSMPLGV